MKKLLISSIAALGLIGTPAFAADMAVKGPPPAPAPVYNWTGWYAGVNLGVSFGHVKTDFNAAPVDVTTVVPAGGFFFTPGVAGSDTAYPSGFHRWWSNRLQLAVFPLIVVGLEADIQGADEKESDTLPNPFSGRLGISGAFAPAITTVTGSTVFDYHNKNRLVWHSAWPRRLPVGRWGRADLSDRGIGLRQGRYSRNEHSQRDSEQPPQRFIL